MVPSVAHRPQARRQQGEVADTTEPSYHPLREFIRLFTKSHLAVISLVVLVGLILTAILAPVVAPYDPEAINMGAKDILAPPSAAHLLGTDEFGRDVLTRVVFGARISLYVSILSVGVGCAVGTAIGLFSGYCGGWVDGVVMRLMDILFAFPTLLLAIALMAFLGANLNNVIIAIAVVTSPRFARIVRGASLVAREREYVEAARMIGARHFRVVSTHILPNVMAPIIVTATVTLGSTILIESTLSFLGLGAQPPTPSWGSMLSNARGWMEFAPWAAVAPGLAIMVVVLSINFVGDGLRDALDPRLRRD